MKKIITRTPEGHTWTLDLQKLLSTYTNSWKLLFLFQTPQMILLTFDGAVNLNNYDHYRKVLNHKRQNQNGCDIKGTFFVSHEYSNYHMIQQLASEGHEIATETISWVHFLQIYETFDDLFYIFFSLQSGLENKGYEEWVGEMVGMRDIIKHLSNISKSDVVGMRAPFLKPGRNTQYKVNIKRNFYCRKLCSRSYKQFKM